MSTADDIPPGEPAPSEPGDGSADRHPDDATRVPHAGAQASPSSPSPADAASASARIDARNLKTGQVLGHTYIIEEQIGRGGMGQVYRARHLELGSLHAIKVILPELSSDPVITELFTREARALRMVHDDAVVFYEGMFRDENGLRYLVMEFASGVSLEDRLRDGPISFAEIRTLRRRLAQGLAAAHDKGIFHRDLAPDNVILVDGKVEFAKIIDFGIIKAVEATDQTVIGSAFAGKFAYASPEQLGLFGGTVDQRSDIYSLGLVLAAAAVGRPLDMGSTPAAAIEARQRVPDLSALPTDLAKEIAPLLEPSPSRRPRSMRELTGMPPGAGDVYNGRRRPHRLLEATKAFRNRPAEPPRRWFRSKLAIGAAAVGVGVLCLLLVFFMTRPAPQAPSAPAKAEASSGGTADQAVPAQASAPVPVAEKPPQGAAEPPYPTPTPTSTPTPTPAAAAASDDQNTGTQSLPAETKVPQQTATQEMPPSDAPAIQPLLTPSATPAGPQTAIREPRHNEAPPDRETGMWGDAVALLQNIGAMSPPAAAPRLAPRRAKARYLEGDELDLIVAASRTFENYLYVDYLESTGRVYRLYPNPAQGQADRPVKKGFAIELPAGTIKEPFGRDLVVAISSRTRLPDLARAEDATSYVAALRRAAPPSEGTSSVAPLTATYIIIETAKR